MVTLLSFFSVHTTTSLTLNTICLAFLPAKMHFSHALVALLSLSASQAVAAPVQNADSSKAAVDMLARAPNLHRTFDAMVARRDITSQQAEEGRTIFARYAHIASDRERSVAVVRDLSKRGILDTLVAAIAQIVNELLGTVPGTNGMRRRQTGPIITYTNELISSAVCLLEALLGVTTSGCSAPAARRDLQSTSLDFSTPEAAKASLADMLSMLASMLSDKADSMSSDANNATTTAGNTTAAANATNAANTTATAVGAAGNATAAALPTAKAKGHKTSDKEAAKKNGSTVSKSSAEHIQSRDLLLTRQETEGIQGLLTVLRSLVDAILNTILPMSQRDETSKPSKKCPPAGTPNDGMYRPGCPGYGRRDVGGALELSSRDANFLQSLLPMLQMLLEELPQLLSGDVTSTTTSNSTMLSGATATPSAADETATATTEGKAKSTGTKNAPISAAKLSIDTRALLGADGFERRQDAATDDGSGTGTANGGTSQSGNTGGVNVSVLNNLLNGLLGGLLGTDTSGSSTTGGLKSAAGVGDSNNGTSQDGNTGGVNVSLLDNLLNGLLGGLLGTSSKRDVGSSLLKSVLGGSHIKRAALTMATHSILSARADFEPVWNEVKALGNQHFTRSVNSEAHSADLVARNELTPVWTSFRDMIDATYAEDHAASSANQRRSPLPDVDTSAFAHASAQFLKQKVFGKRDADLQPLTQAATKFAKTQMQEWTDALNAKAH